MNKIEFTGKSLRSAEDLERLINEAKFEIEYYEKDYKKAQDKLYIRQIALESLLKEQSALLESEYEEMDKKTLSWLGEDIKEKNNV